jgi:hypothetical protein
MHFQQLEATLDIAFRVLFGYLFAFRLTVDRTEMSRREEAENQGNSGLAKSRRFEPMGLPFPKWSMLQEGGFKRSRLLFLGINSQLCRFLSAQSFGFQDIPGSRERG